MYLLENFLHISHRHTESFWQPGQGNREARSAGLTGRLQDVQTGSTTGFCDNCDASSGRGDIRCEGYWAREEMVLFASAETRTLASLKRPLTPRTERIAEAW